MSAKNEAEGHPVLKLNASDGIPGLVEKPALYRSAVSD